MAKKPNCKDIGQIGENFAAAYLQQKGYRIITRNWQTRWGEIDLVAEKEDTLIFIEVKTRTIPFKAVPLHPAQAFTWGKYHRLKKAINFYLLQNNPPQKRFQIDVIAVTLTPQGKLLDLTHYPNITFEFD